MRKRLHYTPNQTTNNLYTFGGEWATVDNIEYIGPYQTYTTGETYTGSEWNPNTSKQLIAYVAKISTNKLYRQLKNIQLGTQTPTRYFPEVTASDRVNGYITRYFIKKQNDLHVIEIDSAQYTDWTINKIDKNLYASTQLQWWITGDISNYNNNGVTMYGVVYKNKKAVIEAEIVLPGIQNKLINYTELYTDTTYSVPPDIN
jgi:hypothetical protein